MTLKLYFMKFSERKLSQCILPLIELNSLCKHIKQVRSSQPTIVYTKLNKTQFFPVSIVKTIITTVTPENLEDGGTREVWEKGQNQLHLTSDGYLYIFGWMGEFQFQISLHGQFFLYQDFSASYIRRWKILMQKIRHCKGIWNWNSPIQLNPT